MAGRIVIVIGALVLGLAVGLVLLVFVAGFGVGRHSSGGCNYVPLVNGTPAYNCPTPPP